TAAERAAALTRQLLAFSRKQRLEPRLLDVNAVVAGLHSILERQFGDTIVLETELEPSLPLVFADAARTEDAIMNLAANARDAMPNGGTVRIVTSSVEFGPTRGAHGAGLAQGRYVRLAIADTGV